MLADLIDCIHTSAQIYFHISDQMFCPVLKTGFTSISYHNSKAVHLTAAAIDKQTQRARAFQMDKNRQK